jgi:hypothetical protein
MSALTQRQQSYQDFVRTHPTKKALRETMLCEGEDVQDFFRVTAYDLVTSHQIELFDMFVTELDVDLEVSFPLSFAIDVSN